MADMTDPFAIVIPARFASTRYPGKPLAALRGAGGQVKPLIRRSWEAAMAVPGVARVVIATDDARIADAARGFGAEVAMTPETCANGTERCAAVLPALAGIDIVVNLQGDAPLTPPAAVTAIVARLRDDPSARVATPALRCAPELYTRLVADQRAGRVGGTTVVADAGGRALYFSKRVIPYVPDARAGDPDLPVFLHLGVYAYRVDALAAYAALPECALERLEGLEQLRFLDAGMSVAVVAAGDTEGQVWELNNPSDIAPIETMLAARGIA